MKQMEQNMVKKSQLVEGEPVSCFTSGVEELNSGLPSTNPAGSHGWELNPGHSNYKSSALTARPRCLPQYVGPIAPTEICIILHILSNLHSIFFSVFIVNIVDISTIKTVRSVRFIGKHQ